MRVCSKIMHAFTNSEIFVFNKGGDDAKKKGDGVEEVLFICLSQVD